MFPATRQLSHRIFAALLLSLSFSLAHADDDPPSRVARLNYLDGIVSFAPAGTDDWVDAGLNRPLTTGDRLWVEQKGRSELHVGSSAMRLGETTSLEILDLSDDNTQLKVTQGSFAIRVRHLEPDETVEIDTPNLAFVIGDTGEYRFDVNADSDNTAVTIRSGSGTAYGSETDSHSTRLRAGQRIRFSGADLAQDSAGAVPPRDDFDRWASARDAREDNSPSARYVSREMTGYEALDNNGDWQNVEGYGAVWIPRVTAENWAPYQFGHWAWIAPWGWTWVDDEPWGFAPFHYGRWAHIDNRWGWVPGRADVRPVYAPALVGFVGGGNGGAHWGISLSVGTPGMAWFPLAPGERYRPAYTSNTTYVTNINRTIIVNQRVERNVYINQRVPNAITVMSADAFVKGQSAHDNARSVPQERLRELSTMPVASSVPVAPVRQSFAGNAHPAHDAPPARAFDHATVARRQAPEAPALHDDLAHKFAAQQGVVPGVGPVFTPSAKSAPRHDDHPAAAVPTANPPAMDERSRHDRPDDRGSRQPDARPEMPRPSTTAPPPAPVAPALDHAHDKPAAIAPSPQPEPGRGAAHERSGMPPSPAAEPPTHDAVPVMPPPARAPEQRDEHRPQQEAPRNPNVNAPPPPNDRPQNDERVRDRRGPPPEQHQAQPASPAAPVAAPEKPERKAEPAPPPAQHAADPKERAHVPEASAPKERQEKGPHKPDDQEREHHEH